MEVNELVGRLRRCVEAAHNCHGAPLRYADQVSVVTLTGAADALETMAGHIENLTGALLAEQDEVALKQAALAGVSAKNDELAAKVAAMAPVVEAALCLRLKSEGSNMWDATQWAAWDDMQAALATLEAANV